MSAYYKQMLLHLKSQDSHIPENSTLFFGDSIIQGLCVTTLSGKFVNFGIGTDTTKGLMERINEYLSIKTAKGVLLYIGGNDMAFFEIEESIENIESIIGTIPTRTPVYVCSILPVDEKIRDRNTNNNITILNKRIERVCSRIDNAFFIDFAAQFKDSRENLAKDLHCGDGKHLNSQGYILMTTFLREYFNKNNPDILLD